MSDPWASFPDEPPAGEVDGAAPAPPGAMFLPPPKPERPKPLSQADVGYGGSGAVEEAEAAGKGRPEPVAADPWDDFENPKPTDEAAQHAPASAIARASLAPNPETQILRYAEHFKQSPDDFRIISGHVVRKVPETGAYAYVEPESIFAGKGAGDTLARAGKYVASGAGPAIPAIAGGVAAAAATPFGLLGAAPAGAAAGAGAEAGRQWLDKALADDKETPLDWANIGQEGAFNGAGPVVGKALGALGRLVAKMPWIKPLLSKPGAIEEEGGKNVLGLSKETHDQILAHIDSHAGELERAAQDAADLGLMNDLGQDTRSQHVMAMIRDYRRTPEGMQAFANRRAAQAKAYPAAAEKTLNDMALPKVSPEQAVSGFRDAAEDVTQKALGDRGVIAKKAYGDALDARTDRFWNEDVDKLMNRPSMERAIGHAKKIAAELGEDITVPVYDKGKMVGRDVVPDWRSWDYVKQGLDAVIDENTNEFGKVNAYGRAVSKTRKALLDQLDTANPDYKAARAKYGSASDATNMILDGGVGFIRNMKGLDAQSMVNRVLGGKIMPEEIGRMRNQFATAGKIKDWDTVVRNYIEDGLTSALTPPRGGVLNNPAGAIRQSFFDDPRQAEVLRAAIGDPQKLEPWEKFGRALESARHQLAEGSPTATADMLHKSPVKKAVTMAKSAVSLKTGHGALDVIDHAISSQSPTERKKIIQYLMGGTEGNRAMRSLPKVITPYNQSRSNAILATIMTNAGLGTGAAAIKSRADE